MIRLATIDDLEQCLALGREYHRVGFQDRPYLDDKVRVFLTAIITQPEHILYVYWRDGKIAGGIAGSLGEEWYNNELVAYEQAFFICPSVRHGLIALRLMTAFQAWAKEMGATEMRMGITTTGNTAGITRLYHAFGLVSTGPQFTKRIY